MSKFDVVVVGGAGHVGAPLAMVLASRGQRTLAYDINRATLAQLARGEMPFLEEGGPQLLASALASGRLAFSADTADIAGVPIVILTIGTPIDEFHNPKVEIVTRCIDQLLPHLSFDQTIVLRSTVSPGVTEYVARYLAKHGKPLGVAFAPERVVQGFAIREMQDIAQIVSGTTPGAEEVAARLFGTIAPKIVRMRPKEAEFAKLITNAYRYIQFAAANQFYMLVEDAGLDYGRVLTGMKQDYPRLRDFPGPGFAAGPCLMKDTMQLAAFGSGFGFGSMAMRINEGMPGFIVERVARRHDLVHSTVGILGMTFKAESDDIRDALSYKLGKILRFRGASVLYSDEYAKDPTFISKEELIERSDIVIVGVPHAAYRTICVPDRVDLVDLWGVLPRKAS
ncbi:MAG: nucleotide sugar dehydrogenase [Chloroflexota bacterium]|nr:nucleotide sugar dehydrogenase [Chloroflexota bacterium]